MLGDAEMTTIVMNKPTTNETAEPVTIPMTTASSVIGRRPASVELST